MRFFIEGFELDVQDPGFFMDEVEYIVIKQSIDEMLENYAELSMDKSPEKKIL